MVPYLIKLLNYLSYRDNRFGGGGVFNDGKNIPISSIFYAICLSGEGIDRWPNIS